MIEIKHILCPVDFSDHSRRALDHAVAVARWYDSTITLLHVHAVVPPAAYAPGAPMPPPAILTPGDRDSLLGALRRFGDGDVGSSAPVRFELLEGDATTVILDRARALPADLLIMGTHGRSGFERLMLGSVTEKVLRKSACPVMSVPGRAPDAAPLQPVLFKRILCATDFSDSATHALNYAMSLAQEADARLTVLHVMELHPEMPTEVHEVRVTHPLAAYATAVEDERRERLKTAVPDTVRAYCTVESILETGKAHQQIVRVAAEQQSDLIVMGVHGRSAADLLFFGSTTQQVVRHAACPVLTLRR